MTLNFPGKGTGMIDNNHKVLNPNMRERQTSTYCLIMRASQNELSSCLVKLLTFLFAETTNKSEQLQGCGYTLFKWDPYLGIRYNVQAFCTCTNHEFGMLLSNSLSLTLSKNPKP